MIIRLLKMLFFISFGALFLMSCVTHPNSVNYGPSTTMTLAGKAQVNNFKYLPAEAPPAGKSVMKPNQIRNTAMGQIIIDKNVSQFFRDALFTELKFSGVTVANSANQIEGEIEDFLVDDLGYSIDWTLRVKYRVSKAGQKTPSYEQTKTIQRKTEKFGNFFGAINETMKLNIEELFKDASFRNAIK